MIEMTDVLLSIPFELILNICQLNHLITLYKLNKDYQVKFNLLENRSSLWSHFDVYHYRVFKMNNHLISLLTPTFTHFIKLYYDGLYIQCRKRREL